MSVLDQLSSWDHSLFWMINRDGVTPWLDRAMPVIAEPKIFMPFLICGGLALLIWGGAQGRLFILLIILALVIGDGGINWSLKHGVHRPRPYQEMVGVREVKRERVAISTPDDHSPKGNSFTSGHACNNFALAFMACFIYGRRMSWLWFWAGIIGYSRIYTGDHFPTDIIGSLLIALLYSQLIVMVVKVFWNTFVSRYWPTTFAAYPNLFLRKISNQDL